MRGKNKYESLEDALRDAMDECELSYKRLAEESGVVRQSLMRFAKGESSLRLDMADRLAAYFEIEITRRKAE